MALTQIELGMLKDGILTADTAGRLKMADGFVNSAKMAAGAARANFGAGAVLQMVQTTTTTQVINNSSSWVSTGLSLSITPSASTSKILALVTVPVTFGDNGGNAWIGVRLTRSGTQIAQTVVGNNVQYIVQQFDVAAFNYLDSPSTTSSTTYQVDFTELVMAARYGNTMVCNSTYGSPMATLQLLEIAG
jgi:hypothetical protein